MNDDAPRRALFFDDFEVGDAFVSAPGSSSEARIVAFAGEYDPQGFHLDREAAGRSIFGGLVASGFQTMPMPSG